MSQHEFTHAALAVPEILVLVAQNLNHKDFLQTVLVCRSWHTILIPLLWQTLTIPSRWRMKAIGNTHVPTGFPDASLFKLYGHLVRSLSGNSIDQDLSYLVPWCGELTDLEVVDVTIWTLPLLVLNSATLRSLTFKRGRDIVGKDFSTPMSSQALSLSSTSGVLEFLKAMNDCQFLERLRLDDFEIEKHNQGLNRGGSQIRRIRSATEIAEAIATAAAAAAAAATAAPSASASRSPSAAQKASKAEQEAKALAKIKEETTASIDLVYRMAQKLTRLELIGRVILTPPPDRTLVFYRLRRLSLNGCSMSYRDQLQFICQCQYLTRLKLLVNRDSEHLDPEDLASMELNVHCPLITHLDLSWSTLQDQEIAMLLQYLPRLVSFLAQRTSVGQKTIDMLTGCQSVIRDQLQELDLVDARDMQSRWIQQLLCSCSGLRQFRATEINAREMIDAAITGAFTSPAASSSLTEEPSAIDTDITATTTTTTTAAVPGSWVCLQLQELQLSISGISPRSSYQDQQIVYDQLSKLTQLRILSLGGNSHSTWFRMQTLDLSLQSGFDRLSTLKELRTFNFSYMAHELGMAEVEFMMEHWKNLTKAIGTISASAIHGRTGSLSGTGFGIGNEGLENGNGNGNGNGNRNGPGRAKVERPELIVHRRWPSVEFCSR